MISPVLSIDVFEFRREPDQAYLGSLDTSDTLLNEHHFVRGFNGTVYPTTDRSVVIRVRDANGNEGWGETYGLVAPKAVAALVHELFGPYLCSLEATTPDKAWDALYALQRNRGYWGGYLADTLAAIDIALWDLHCHQRNISLQQAFGFKGAGEVNAYVSGLPKPTTEERVELALSWKERGFQAVKIPISATENGDVAKEFDALRVSLGAEYPIALDLHWTHDLAQMKSLENSLQPYNPWYFEAPTKPEDIQTQIDIAKAMSTPMAIGEEWRSEWDYRPRLQACQIVQPEMGHTGVTQFVRIARMAQQQSAQIMPHATIGLGIFMAASLRASVAVGASFHEFQHTIYHRNGALLEGIAKCEAGKFIVPDTVGHGVKPNADGLNHLSLLEV